ncbi:Spectrin beta chain, non-erythrocytic 1, partial [Xenoophorus captivus]
KAPCCSLHKSREQQGAEYPSLFMAAECLRLVLFVQDEQSSVAMLKKHQILEQAVEDYADTVHQLSSTSRGLVAAGHPDSERIGMRQSQVDKLYAGLKDLAEERRGKLDERFRLFQLNREVDDLEQWIAEREVVAGSHELGQDYEHVTVSTDGSFCCTPERQITSFSLLNSRFPCFSFY